VTILMKNLLFLCTGNYYRSRFCEEYFNHRAQRHGLAWRADSRGLAPDLTVFRNPGPLSPYTHQALSALGVAFGASLRAPRAAQPSDFARADRLIALSRAEHQPMVERFFPAHARAMEYWEVGDLPVASPAEALETMTRAVHELIDALRGETSPAPILEHSVSRLSSSRGPTVGVDSAVDVDRAVIFFRPMSA
jgi:protein-tyrosine phosphatase